MSRPGILTLGVLAAALALVISLELNALRSGHPASRPSERHVATLMTGDRTLLAGDHSQDWSSTILARPLFSETRRPPPGTAASGAGVGTPRLSGVLVSRSDKRAIFAASAGGKALVAGEGARIGAFVLQSITAGQVTLIGPGGVHVLRPSFDAAAKSSPASSAAFAPIPPPPTVGGDKPDTFPPNLAGVVQAGPLPARRTTQ